MYPQLILFCLAFCKSNHSAQCSVITGGNLFRILLHVYSNGLHRIILSILIWHKWYHAVYIHLQFDLFLHTSQFLELAVIDTRAHDFPVCSVVSLEYTNEQFRHWWMFRDLLLVAWFVFEVEFIFYINRRFTAKPNRRYRVLVDFLPPPHAVPHYQHPSGSDICYSQWTHVWTQVAASVHVWNASKIISTWWTDHNWTNSSILAQCNNLPPKKSRYFYNSVWSGCCLSLKLLILHRLNIPTPLGYGSSARTTTLLKYQQINNKLYN